MAKKPKKDLLSEAPKIDNELELKQYPIDWNKIANDVKEAATLVETQPEEKPKKVTRKKKEV